MMNEAKIVEYLTELCEKLGIVVRFEPLATSGGLCDLRGRKTLFVGTACSRAEQIATICEALSEADLEGIYILPEVREVLETQFRRIQAERLENEKGRN